VFIDNVGSVINTEFADYSPIVNADETVLFFTSRRNGSTGDQLDPGDGKPFEDIYIAYKVAGEWSAPVNPGKPLNTENHDAVVGLSPDGQRLFLYRGDRGGDIYECFLEGDKWSKPERLDKNINTEFHESSAAFSYDLKTIYFVSNKPEGFGGHDLYVSMLMPKGTKWGPAINLGTVINTAFDEEAVFFHPDGKTLYFSSKGHKTMGGYDVFKSVFENGKWSEPENLGYPINTTEDDVFFTITADGKYGYYSSAREGGQGGHDIYRISFLGAEKPLVNNGDDNMLAILTMPVSEIVIEPQVELSLSQVTILKGTITDQSTHEPLKVQLEIMDNSTNDIIANFESNSKTGRYLITLPSGKNYGITARADGYLFHSENVNIAELADFQEIIRNIELKKIAVGSKVVLRNIFFDTGKSQLRSESTAELDRLTKLLLEMPALTIEISGHTDNVGSATSNKKLSNDRAKSVVDYLVKNGIASNRLTFIGYGFDQPIAPNDTEDGRQQNRRTEFKITGN
jgi:outer membrane protein OmpA-like peptidoglycan-associated protein